MNNTLLVIVLSFALLGGQISWAQTETAAQVLAQSRKASHYPIISKTKESLVLEGSARFSGTEAKYQLAFNSTGAFRESFWGTLPQVTGYDGKSVWRVDYSQMPRLLEMEERDEARLVMSVLTGSWLVGNKRFDLVPVTSTGNSGQVKMSFLSGHLAATVGIDTQTWLVRNLSYTTTNGPQQWEFRDYLSEHGLRIAHQWSHHSGDGTDRIILHSVCLKPFAPSRYNPVTRKPADTKFNMRVSPQVPILRVESGHLLIRPRIDGKDVGWFILDSGAGVMVLDPRTVSTLHLHTFGSQASSGAAALVQTSYCRGRTFTLGPLTLTSPLYAQFDLSLVRKAFHLPIAGVCGYDLFSRAVLKIDKSRHFLSIFPPSRYHLAAGHWQPMFLDEGTACVQCRFEGNRMGIFSIDTGSSGSVDFLGPAVKSLGLLNGRITTTTKNSGIGGSFENRKGRISWFDLGGYRFMNPEVGFTLTSQGDMSGHYETGNIGEKFLAPFTLVFDYPHRRIAFVQQENNFSHRK